MKQADVLAVIKHIAERQLTNKPEEVFRFLQVATSRKTQDSERLRAARYPGDLTEEEVADDVAPPLKARRTRAKKGARKDDTNRAQQREMEGVINLNHTQVAVVAAEALPLHPAIPHITDIRPQAVADAVLVLTADIAHVPDTDDLPATHVATIPPMAAPNYGGIPTFGPNDPVQQPWPQPAAAFNQPMYGHYQYPMSPVTQGSRDASADNHPVYPAGIPLEAMGVIDPALIGLRAGPPQLPTPRASVTPHLSPIKLQSDTNSLPDVPVGRVMKPKPTPKVSAATSSGKTKKGKGKGKQPTVLPAVREEPAEDLPVLKPPRARPKGKAAIDSMARITKASTANVDRDHPAEKHRKTADVLAAAEANALILPAKRVRTAKVRTA